MRIFGDVRCATKSSESLTTSTCHVTAASSRFLPEAEPDGYGARPSLKMAWE